MTDEAPDAIPSQSSFRPRVWVAALLSVLTTGLGHLYAGAPWRGLAVWAAGVAVGFVGLWLALTLPGRLQIAVLLVIIVGIPVGAAWDAVRVARRRRTAYRRRWYQRWYVYAATVAVAVFGIQPFVLRELNTNVAGAYKLPSGSMEPTLLAGDYVLMARSRAPVRRQSLVVYRSELGTFVKRVVGLPGDTIAMRDGQLLVNGRPLLELYARAADHDPVVPEFAWQRQYLAPGIDSGAYTPSLDTWGPLVVPPGQYFLLGDNRGESLDSRYLGFVPAANILGRPTVVYLSMDPGTGRVRWSRIGHQVG